MFRTLFVGFILFSSVSLLAQPKIKIEEGTSLDFGDIYTGLKADKILTVRNMGNDTLRISDVHAQCGCTAAMMKPEDMKLAPGGSGKLSISFDTHNYPGLKVTKQVYISSNDTSNARLTISFNVNVVNVLDIKPTIISFNEAKMESVYSKSVTVTNPGKESIKILSLGASIDQVKVNMAKMQLMPGESTQLQAVFHPSTSGTFEGAIDINTDSKALPKLTVKVYAWVTRK